MSLADRKAGNEEDISSHQMHISPDQEEPIMRNLFKTTIFSIVSIVGAQAFASDIEDYTGLPVYQDDMIASPQAEVINEGHTSLQGVCASTWSQFHR